MRKKKMIPIKIEVCELPYILYHVSLVDYTKVDLIDWFWRRLYNTIVSEDAICDIPQIETCSLSDLDVCELSIDVDKSAVITGKSAVITGAEVSDTPPEKEDCEDESEQNTIATTNNKKKKFWWKKLFRKKKLVL